MYAYIYIYIFSVFFGGWGVGGGLGSVVFILLVLKIQLLGGVQKPAQSSCT